MTALHDWLAERDRLARVGYPLSATCPCGECADARESQPRLVAMVRVLETALRKCEQEATAWQEAQEGAAYNIASPTTQVEALEKIGELHSCGVNVAVTDALRRVSAIAAGEQSAQREGAR